MLIQPNIIIGQTHFDQIEEYLRLFALHKELSGIKKYRIKRKLDFLRLKIDNRFRCVKCKKQEPDIKLERDHIVTLLKGGSDKLENIQPLCMMCNKLKGSKAIDYRNI